MVTVSIHQAGFDEHPVGRGGGSQVGDFKRLQCLQDPLVVELSGIVAGGDPQGPGGDRTMPHTVPPGR